MRGLVAWVDRESGPVVLANVRKRIEALLHLIDGGNQSAFCASDGGVVAYAEELDEYRQR